MTPEREGREGDSQPMPVANGGRLVHYMVVSDLLGRMELGARRYGTPLQPHNGRDALLDMYEELLDAVCYLKQYLLEQES